MNFLQPWILAALPLIALPIIIHLINRNRHRSVPWAAMMFLQKANRMNKGMARLRYVLVMLMRMAAVAAIIFAISRPLVSSKLGFSWGKPDATVILLDRSASMETLDLQSGQSKRSTALRKLAELLEKRNYGNQLILIDSATGELRSLESPADLVDLPMTGATATSANLPAMMEKAVSWLKANEATRADLWICSDLSENDWNAESGRWTAIREELAGMKGVQEFLLSYADPPEANLSVRVANVKRRQTNNQSELVLDLFVKDQAARGTAPIARSVPVEFEINGVRSVIEMQLDAQGASLLGHRIPIDGQLRSGWGAVTLPPDSNPLDNTYYFVFSEPPVRKAVVVSDDTRIGEAFRRCLAIPSESGIEHDARILPSSRIGEIDWDETALLIWQSALPGGLIAEEMERFVEGGRVAMFFPPTRGSTEDLFGARWGDWQEFEEEEDRKLSWWRGDTDLLAHVGSGDPLPLSELRTSRYCALDSAPGMPAATPLARLASDRPLLRRAATDRGAVYFCSTLPTGQFSSLERDAVSFYVMLQRAMAEGSKALTSANDRVASAELIAQLADFRPVAPDDSAGASSERGLRAGVFRKGKDWIAVNRGAEEDEFRVTPVTEADQLFAGLSYQRIDDAVGDTSSLASEVWRAFLYLMAAALMLEAILCLPEKKTEENPGGGFASTNS